MFNKHFSIFLLLFVFLSSITYTAEPQTPRKAFSEALKKGDLSQIQSMIESSAVGIEEIPENDFTGSTPLVEAAGFAQVPIMKYLIEKGEFAKDRIQVAFFGETKPIETNETKEGRKKNRRVEFKILKL